MKNFDEYLKNRTFKIFIVFTIAYGLISGLVYMQIYYNKKSMAESIHAAVKNLILNRDYREAIISLNQNLDQKFDQISFYNENKMIFTVRKESIQFGYDLFAVKIKIYFQDNQFLEFSYINLKFILFTLSLYVIITFTLYLLWDTFVRKIKIEYDQSLRHNRMLNLNNLSQKLAHDIRSPISTLNLISSKIDDPDLKSLQLAVVQQINAIANDLLNEAKNPQQQLMTNENSVPIPNSADVKLEPTQYLVKMLKNLEKEYQFKALAISQKIIFEIDYAQIEKNVVTQKLTSIIYACINNFVQNAIEASAQNGEIKITANKNSENKIEISVCDSGKGIPEHILKRLGHEILSHGKSEHNLKDNLTSEPSTGEIKSGNGIALYNANKELAENGAKLVISSIENVGSQFRILI